MGRRKAFPEGLSRGQEETGMVSAVPPNCTGPPPVQDSSPMLSGVSQCSSPEESLGWGTQVLFLETSLCGPDPWGTSLSL